MSRTLLAAIALLAACGKGSSGPADAGQQCATSLECTEKNTVCDRTTHTCVPTCLRAADCASGLVCESGSCISPACSSSADCPGQTCLGGACAPPPAQGSAASCDVTPAVGVVHAGATLQLTAVAQDSGGKAIPFIKFSWSASGPATVDAPSGLVSGTGAGDVTVTATVLGTSTSCRSQLKGFATPSSGMRVVVIDRDTKAPIDGAKVVIDSLAPFTTVNGVVTANVLPGKPHDVHVFAAGYSYSSYIQTTSADLLVPLPAWVPQARRAGFSGSVDNAFFAPLAEQGQPLHLAFFGSGIPNSVLDLSIDTLIGPLRPVHLEVGSLSADTSLPYGLVIGLTTNFFGTGSYRMYADQGKRALWGLGGNLDPGVVLTILAPLLGNSNSVDVGALLSRLLPLLGKLQAGARIVTAPPNASPGAAPAFTPMSVPLDTPLRLRATAQVPKLPKVDGKYVDGVVALAGAMDFPIGYVPLGLTAGLAYKDASGGDGSVVDPACGNSTKACATSQLTLQLAPANGGAEGSQYGFALLALNFGSLAPGGTGAMALSGLIQGRDRIAYTQAPAAAPAVTYPAFMNLPQSTGAGSVALDKAARKVTLSGDADPGTQLYRFEVSNAEKLSWSVWLPPTGPSTRDVTLPDPAALVGLGDPLADKRDPAGICSAPSARLLALQLSDPRLTDSDGYRQLTSFGSLTLDALGSALTAFTAASVAVGNAGTPTCP